MKVVLLNFDRALNVRVHDVINKYPRIYELDLNIILT